MPPKCLRTGCPAPQTPRSPIGLCEAHHLQLQDGTIGVHRGVQAKEWPTAELAALIAQYDHDFHPYTWPHTSYRRLGRELGVSKDTIDRIRHHTWPVVRSEPAEAILENIAKAYWRGKPPALPPPPRRRSKRSWPKNTTKPAEQLTLF